MKRILRLRAVEFTLTLANNFIAIVGIVVVFGGIELTQAGVRKFRKWTRGP